MTTIYLPSGNWFSEFKADVRSGTVKFNYYDRRRNQVARRYAISFEGRKVTSIIAVSAAGGRVESFSTCRVIDDVRAMWVHALMEDFEASFAEEVGDTEDVIPTVEPEVTTEDSLESTVKMIGFVTALNLLVTLVTLGIVWYNF